MKVNDNLIFKRQIVDEETFKRTLMRLSYEIIEKYNNLDDVLLVGISSRGVPIAKQIKENIKKTTAKDIEITSLDIKYYRDDLQKVDINPQVRKDSFKANVDNKTVVIVDDVLFTGRTARAAIDAIFDQGRPSKVSLLVLIDRGHRELPIRPDFVGKNIPTSMNEVISVNIEPIDNKTNVEILEKTNA